MPLEVLESPPRLEHFQTFHSHDGEWLVLDWHMNTGEKYRVAIPHHFIPTLREQLDKAEAVLAENRANPT